MKKKKTVSEEKPVEEKENNLDAMEDMHVYAAGHEADKTLEEDDITKHTNGGIPDGTETDEGDKDDNDDDDDD